MTQQRTNVRFTVKEGNGPDQFWITLESGVEIDVMRHGFFGFDLKSEVTFKEAQALALLLNQRVASLFFLDAGRAPVDTTDENPPRGGVSH